MQFLTWCNIFYELMETLFYSLYSSIDNGNDRDYATLEKMSPRSPPGPIVPGVHSSTPLGGIARRFSNDFATGSRANLIINQNGEPELVADLM